MPALTRATGLAAVALVAAVGVGGLLYVSSNGAGQPDPTPSPTSAATEVAPGIPGWTTYASAVHGFTIGYPVDWSVQVPATRAWRTGDAFPANELPYADTFVSPGQGADQVGLIAWTMPAGNVTGIDTAEGLRAWAQEFCTQTIRVGCETFTQRAQPMDWIRPGGQYTSAMLVPTADAQYALLAECNSCLLIGATDVVTVVVIARQDGFPPAARYGGSVELLKAILKTMYVVPPSGSQPPAATPTPSANAVTWKPFTSTVYNHTVSVPVDWSNTPATRTWEAGDTFPGDELPFADMFVSPGIGDVQIGVLAWEMPEGDGFDIESFDSLRGWAQQFCADIGGSSCASFTERTVTMCLNHEYFTDGCGAAILVPTAGAQYAFFPDPGSFIFGPDMVRVVVLAREDSFPAAAAYGGSVTLLKAVLATMGVVPPTALP